MWFEATATEMECWPVDIGFYPKYAFDIVVVGFRNGLASTACARRRLSQLVGIGLVGYRLPLR